ncbi:hypothetical protein SARC_12707 [Sphaeroforma arctica JP610]|uniref:TP53 regulated inhibitor of apoptosis 1 n=1 Tax=Sphaeroforma arctica JP610 TaxID=667725 RepID=A0A0L0FDB1_9EUKA|nr:hypothetical protein SARC_12707 [Sphaeroforma arctica JP610]KNC74754.1 hypothetical protein SARC_12707 [Sphaeroforma arctica JP610]|eukprot:XP_014148656.1 hypothetical protein SARC_12707 [Sphaeroforma arctica JP610]
MNSVGEQCTALKAVYDECFNKWYTTKFLQGEGRGETECDKLFETYKSCVMKAIEEKKIFDDFEPSIHQASMDKPAADS